MFKKKLIICSALTILFLEIWTRPNLTPPASIKVFDRNQILLYETSLHHQNVRLDTLPKYLVDAVIASEDVSFWSNPGFDLAGISRAVINNVYCSLSTDPCTLQGASTITQQLARQSFKNSHNIYLRKIREILTSIRLTYFASKQSILENYLNQIYFGENSYGIQAASLTFFGKDSSQLSLSESALLVGLISSPEIRNPKTNLSESLKFQHLILDRMMAEKYITADQSSAAKQEEINIKLDGGSIKAPHFVHHVLGQLPVGNKNLKVYTTLDYPVYELGREIAGNLIKKLSEKHDLTNAALVLLDNRTGEILTMLGGVNYFDSANSGQVNMATSLRQPGSSIKPITYAEALAQKILTPATVIYDIPKVFSTQKGEGFQPQNYDGRYHGMVLARTALASSLNLPAVEVLSRIGLPAFFESSLKLGITSFTDTSRLDLAVTLGGGEVSLLQLTNAYASFARGGKFLPVHAITKITKDDDHILFNHQTIESRPVFAKDSQKVSYLISDILSDPKARMMTFGEKNPLVLDRPAAVKTGTTTDWHDNWTIGYTPSYTVGVWVGNNDNRPMRQITGVVGAAPIWNQFFSEFLKGKPIENFTRPEGISDREVCAFDGKLPGNCPQKILEKFISGTEPTEISTYPDFPDEVFTWAKTEGLLHNTAILPEISFVQIIFPVSSSNFQTAPEILSHQSLTFEVNLSSDIQAVSWYLNGRLIGESNQFPYSFNWTPKVGRYTLQAVAHSTAKQLVQSNTVTYTVSQFPD